MTEDHDHLIRRNEQLEYENRNLRADNERLRQMCQELRHPIPAPPRPKITVDPMVEKSA